MVATKPAPDERAPAAPLAPRGPAAVLALQRSAGNAAVVAMLQREPVAEAERTTPPDLDPAPGHRPEVELLQQKLNWHRGSARVPLLLVDGKFGGKTKAAVIAFKRARRITPHTVTVDGTTWEALARPPVSGKPRAGKGGPGLRPHVRGRPARDHDRARLRRARQRGAGDGADHPGAQGRPRLPAERREGPRAARGGGAAAVDHRRHVVRQGERRHVGGQARPRRRPRDRARGRGARGRLRRARGRARGR